MFAKISEWLKGKKTYIVAAITFIAGGLTAIGVEVPTWVYAVLASMLGITLRAGVAKTEK